MFLDNKMICLVYDNLECEWKTKGVNELNTFPRSLFLHPGIGTFGFLVCSESVQK